jgi:hypothetical protein
MGTELEIVYSIIETVEKGALTDDKKIDERVVRSFLRTYRASVLAKATMEGILISDECFQHLGTLEFTATLAKEYSRMLPKIIRLENNFGLMFSKNGENIPVVSSEEFALSRKSIINGRLPKAKVLGSIATVYVGAVKQTSCGNKPAGNYTINDFSEEIIANNGSKVTVDVNAILDNPDDAPGYDWTSDPFPFPSDLVEEVKTRILRKEYNIILQINGDKVTDGNDETQGKPNTVR